jgi:hypothetical protein
MKSKLKDQMIRLIEADSREKAAAFSIAFARAPSEEKETFLAAMEFERWVADTCRECLGC